MTVSFFSAVNFLRLSSFLTPVFSLVFSLVWSCSLSWSTSAIAADSAESSREAALFGGGEVGGEEEPYQFDENALFSEDAVIRDQVEEFAGEGKGSIVDLFGQKLNDADNRLDIGGQYYHSSFLLYSEHSSIGESRISHTGVVDIYFDAQLEDDVRFFYQQKVVHSFDAGESPILLFLSQFSGDSPVDQLWLKFKVKNKYFVTLGKQPTKWGSGLVWQPTDFLNAQKFNPLELIDQRLGVSLLKVEYPISNRGINLYSVLQVNDANQVQDLGWLWRAEFLTEVGEYAISLAAKNNDALKVGFDLSRGLGPVDLRFDMAVIHDDHQPFYEGEFNFADGLLQTPTVVDRRDEWMPQVSTGFLYSRSFKEDYHYILTVEYLYNDLGYDNSELLSWSIINSLIPNGGSFSPLYYSQEYVTIGSMITGFGADNDVSVNVLVIGNLSDGSGVVQGVYSAQPFRDLGVSFSVGWFFGGDGTFRPDVALLDTTLLEGINLNLPRYSTEVQLRVKF
ncbi:MAG: hypothetical protein KUG82_04465 [Pseudomonadales bacterium]|nr:hypothetical protein [Pseudomonadales bacterium]